MKGKERNETERERRGEKKYSPELIHEAKVLSSLMHEVLSTSTYMYMYMKTISVWGYLHFLNAHNV